MLYSTKFSSPASWEWKEDLLKFAISGNGEEIKMEKTEIEQFN
jgi:hypothetical protein